MNIKVNKKLSLIILKHIASLSYKDAICLDNIKLDKQNKLFEFILDSLKESIYFKYKEGTTKFSDTLKIISKEDIFNDYSNEVIILSIDTLDILWIGEYEGYNGQEELHAIEIIGSGDFKNIIEILEEKKYGKLKMLEFDTPIVRRQI